MPAPIGFIVALRLAGLPGDFTEEADKQIEANLLGPGMTLLESLEFEAPVFGPAPGHPAGWEIARLLPLAIRFVAQAEGSHSIDFYVNGRYQQQKTMPLWVCLPN